MDIRNTAHGYHGRIDAAEVQEDGALRIVEYKATPLRRSTETTPAMRRQLALQAIALEEMGHRISGTDVFFTTHNRRVPVELTDDERREALVEVSETRDVLERLEPPPALADDPRCTGCSHVSLCLPDERKEEETTRRISVRDPDGQVLHLATYGSYASLRSGRVRVTHKGEELTTIPIERVQAVVVHGNVDLTSGLLRELLWRRVPVAWCSSSGRLVGFATSTSSPNGAARVAQHVASAEGRIELVREFLGAKIHNQATLLRRHGEVPETVSRLRALSRSVAGVERVQDAFGIEGAAASAYFHGFRTMWSNSAQQVVADFPGRVGRGATDRLNVCLNYVYALLTGDATRAIVACGLDPHAGFLHSSNRNKPALALDLMEEFRPVVADSVVLGAINNGEVRLEGFTDLRGSMRLGDSARKALIAAYERRMNTEFTHPVFGYRVTWRRALEVQARMVLGVLDGSQSRYVGIRVR
jgi:CRISPR-associated protein Cas1